VTRRDGPGFRDRTSECQILEELLRRVRDGHSGALVIRGEAGIGKTQLLEFLAARASDCRVLRTAGVQSEMQLAFAGLHQLCAPLLDAIEELPPPQRDAVGAAFGLRDQPGADPLLLGLGVLGLLSENAGERPLVCVVEDAQWLDQASAQTLGFVARRLGAEPVAIVIAVREPSGEEWGGLAQLEVGGLGAGDARALLESVLPGPLDERVRDRIIEETHGNPLALLELPRGLGPVELAGGFGAPHAGQLSRRIEESYLRRLARLPADTRRLLLVAAADPVSERALVLRAAERLGVGVDATAAAAAAGLCEFGTWVRFRHPLVRSAVYRAASPAERRRAHRALGEATDPVAAPDRRAWHRAHAASAPDEDVAEALERSAERARGRGGLPAAAAFLDRATQLTPDRGARAARALAAAEASCEAGAYDAALRLLVTAEGGPLDGVSAARLDLLRGQIALAQRRGRDAPGLLLKAARHLEPHDGRLARETYLEALAAANLVGRLAGDCGLLDVADAARRALPPPLPASAPDLLLHGLVGVLTDGHRAGVPIVQEALGMFRSENLSREEMIHWLWFASHIALCVWDYESYQLLAQRQLELARETGVFRVLTVAVYSRIGAHLGPGELGQAAGLLEEAEAIAAATGTSPASYVRVCLAALRGRDTEVFPLLEATSAELSDRGEGIGLVAVQWAAAVLYNSLGRHEDALRAIRGVGEYREELWFSGWGAIELIEAAVRSGDTQLAATGLERLVEMTQASGTDLALGIEARSRALLGMGETAERLYRDAIAKLGRTSVRVELARAHLLYGEWLHREGRQPDAREALRTAEEMFTAMGCEAFADRAVRELRAAGGTPRSRAGEAGGRLTAQEAQIARLARDGLSNSEIGARLVISPRTVEYHLHKVFAKLGIGSRRQLATALSHEPGLAGAA
jgi:DNA-binding CsgD family transcriptional regulator